MRLTDHEAFLGTTEYAKYKCCILWWKILLLGIMGGAFISLGYMGCIAIKSGHGADPSGVTIFLASAIFPTGILMCVFLGGSLFTSDALSTLPLLTKEVKWYKPVSGWGIVWVGNFLGAFLIAALAHLSGFNTHAHVEVLQHYVEHKQNVAGSSNSAWAWWAAFGSGVLTNILVAGAVWMSMTTKSVGAKVVLIWFPIALFVMAGFEHVVANFFIFGEAVFVKYVDHNHNFQFDPGRFITFNIIPVTFGNWFAGAALLPIIYYLLVGKKGKSPKT